MGMPRFGVAYPGGSVDTRAWSTARPGCAMGRDDTARRVCNIFVTFGQPLLRRIPAPLFWWQLVA